MRNLLSLELKLKSSQRQLLLQNETIGLAGQNKSFMLENQKLNSQRVHGSNITCFIKLNDLLKRLENNDKKLLIYLHIKIILKIRNNQERDTLNQNSTVPVPVPE